VLEDERDQLESRLRATMDKLQEASKIVDDYERSFLDVLLNNYQIKFECDS